MNEDSTKKHAENIASGVGEAWSVFMRPDADSLAASRVWPDQAPISINELVERVDKLEEAVRTLYMLHGRNLPL
jgi:hypothetical protein